VWRFPTRSCTTGFGDGGIRRRYHGRWRRKRMGRRRRGGKRGAVGSLAGGGAKARGRGGVCR